MKSFTKKLINLSGSVCLILPAAFARDLDMKVGDPVSVVARDTDLLVITKKEESVCINEEAGQG